MNIDDTIHKKYKLLYKKLIKSDIIDTYFIPNSDNWNENKIWKLSWYYYNCEINNNKKKIKKILKDNDFYRYMKYLNTHYNNK